MKYRSLVCILLLIAAVSSPMPLAAEDDFAVIVHPDNAATSIDLMTLSDLFLKKSKAWPDGRAAEPVDQTAEAPVRARFSRRVHGRSQDAVLGYWQRKVFSGRDTPPPALGSDAEIIAFVRRTPGAIGYVSTAANTRDVKVIAVIGARE